MGYVFIQSNNIHESLVDLKDLENTWDFEFELTLNEPQIRPIVFRLRSNLSHNKYHHSFIYKVVCGRWIITHYYRYIWSKKFYWICDCSTTKGML